MAFGLEHSDASTFAVAICLMVGVAGFAALLPALRACRIDPMAALRTE